MPVKMRQHIDIPDNIAKYVDERDGIALNITLNNAFADDGYAHVHWYFVRLSMLTRTCHHCGYDRLWKPNDDDSKCIRHVYDNWRYDDVFVWSDCNNPLSLEEAFDVWLAAQPKSWSEPVKMMTFGQMGWR